MLLFISCHTCSRRSPSEKPAASELLPLCPFTGLTRLVLLHLLDAAGKVKKKKTKNRKSYLTHIAAMQTHVFVVRWNLCSYKLLLSYCTCLGRLILTATTTTELFNDSNDLFFVQLSLLWAVTCEQVFIIFPSGETITAPTHCSCRAVQKKTRYLGKIISLHTNPPSVRNWIGHQRAFTQRFQNKNFQSHKN